ncbi:MAG: transposase [Planctomycetaceae bacterium]
MGEPHLHKRRRNLPHWTLEGCCYFITFRVAQGELTLPERMLVLDHIRDGDEQFYSLAATVVMPDHAHLLLRPRPSLTLSRILKGIKGVSARMVNRARGKRGSLWQDESWDRIVRDVAEFEEKYQYIANNPVSAGLVKHLDDYPAVYLASL